MRMQQDGRGDAFHHFVDYQLGVSVEDEGVPMRDLVVKACCDEECQECNAFVSVFDRQRVTNYVGLANRAYLYERGDKELYNSFVETIQKEVKK